MGPIPIPREYTLQEEVDELKERIDRVTESVVVLTDVIKFLVIKLDGEYPDETAEEILKKAKKMFGS